jgi:nucleotide-binding universal stress UspA family protein
LAGERPVTVLSVGETQAEASRLAEGAAGYLRAHGMAAQPLALVGARPVDALMTEAAAMPASLLVMGSFENTGLRTLFTGSATKRLLHAAPCPVFVAH